VWILILFCFIVQAVAYEFRSKPRNIFGHTTYEMFLYINGAVGTILLGTAVATFFTGSKFSIDFSHLTRLSDPVISRWESPFRGLEAAFNIQNLSLGLTVFFLARILGILFFMHTIDHEEIIRRAKKSLLRNSIPFLVVFLTFATLLLTSRGFAVNPATGVVQYEAFKYLHNLLQMPAVAILFLSGTVLVLCAIAAGLFTRFHAKAIWLGGFGTVFVVFSLFALAGYNNTSYYPSTHDLQSSLTLANSSSSRYTLTIMSWVSLFVPFVLAYIIYAWRQMTGKKITADEMNHDSHIY
jgi:cytochrome bd ubiquinol oxidase subunit II